MKITDKELQSSIVSLKRTVKQLKHVGRNSAAESAENQLDILLELKAYRMGKKCLVSKKDKDMIDSFNGVIRKLYGTE